MSSVGYDLILPIEFNKLYSSSLFCFFYVSETDLHVINFMFFLVFFLDCGHVFHLSVLL